MAGMTETINAQQALQMLREAVAAKGADYVYREQDRDDGGFVQCVYFEGDGSPSCIVGHVLAQLGKREQDLRFEGSSTPNTVGIESVLVDGVELDMGARRVLGAAQRKQDGGATWGAAVLYAEDVETITGGVR